MPDAYWDDLAGILGSCLSQDETPNDPAEEAEAEAAPYQAVGGSNG